MSTHNIHFHTEIRKIPYLLYVFRQKDLSKQCRPRWDAAECSISSGLYCLPLYQQFLDILLGNCTCSNFRTSMVRCWGVGILTVNTVFNWILTISSYCSSIFSCCENDSFVSLLYTYHIYRKNLDTWTSYRTCSKILTSNLLPHVLCKNCLMRGKRCRPWWDAAYCGVSSGTTLSAQACLSEYSK